MTNVALSVREACERVGVSRTRFYELVNSGAIVARKLGKRTIVLTADLDTFLLSLPSIASRTR